MSSESSSIAKNFSHVIYTAIYTQPYTYATKCYVGIYESKIPDTKPFCTNYLGELVQNNLSPSMLINMWKTAGFDELVDWFFGGNPIVASNFKILYGCTVDSDKLEKTIRSYVTSKKSIYGADNVDGTTSISRNDQEVPNF